jgi:L-cysteine/cystine lyase
LHVSGAHVVVVPAEAEAIAAAVTPRTRLIAISHVLWTTGKLLPVHALRRETGVPLLADGAQSAGAIPVQMGDVDFYTVSAQKWLCGPEDTGALFVADPDSLRVAAPSYLSQQSYEPTGAFVPVPGAQRFDSGWIGSPVLAGLKAALDAHPDWRYERAAEMAERCRALLEERVDVATESGQSTLVAFRPSGDPKEVVMRLADRGVVVREIPGTGLVRVSCGYWTSDDDLERLVDAL